MKTVPCIGLAGLVLAFIFNTAAFSQGERSLRLTEIMIDSEPTKSESARVTIPIKIYTGKSGREEFHGSEIEFHGKLTENTVSTRLLGGATLPFTSQEQLVNFVKGYCKPVSVGVLMGFDGTSNTLSASDEAVLSLPLGRTEQAMTPKTLRYTYGIVDDLTGNVLSSATKIADCK